MKLIHFADAHCRKESLAEIHASFDVIEKTGAQEKVDLFAFAGDFWHGPILNSAGTRFAEFIGRVQCLASVAPVVMVAGTPSHDTDGSLEIFEQMQAAHSITVLRPGQAYFLADGRIWTAPTSAAAPGAGMKAIIFGVPEPSKKWLLAEAGAMGKEASDLAVRDATRKLLLDLAVIRKQYPELPCILLYHGPVSGARTGTGFEVPCSGIAVAAADLAVVGADYYALGDIHEPQQIPGIPAYYSGSIYPGNRGETHRAGCNLVYIGNDASEQGREVQVQRIDFPHPRWRKVCLRLEKIEAEKDLFEDEDLSTLLFDGDFPVPGDLLAEKCWLEISGPRAILAALDTDAMTQRLLGSGFLPGTEVTTNPDPETTVRVAAIAAARGLPDKVRAWAEATALEVPETATEKAGALERELGGAAAGAVGARYRIQSLRLRGAKGIWKGQHRDEVFIDLDGLGEGILVLFGRNGRGKTTVLENMHPWPQMLTRDGVLRSHFRLRDSCRELVVVDDVTGIRYKFLININAATASGGAEYYIHQDVGTGWTPYPDVNGRQDPYLAVVQELFGSLALYVRTAFVPQRPTRDHPDLAEATKGQRKLLFYELAGVDYFDRYRAQSKATADAIDSEIIGLNATIVAAADVGTTITALEQQIAEATATEVIKRAESKTAVQLASDLEHEEIALEREAVEYERKAERKTNREESLATIPELRTRDLAAIADYETAAAGKIDAECELARIRDLEQEASTLKDEEAALARVFEEKVRTYNADAVKVEGERKEYQKVIDKYAGDIVLADKIIAVAAAALEKPLLDNCPTCGQVLPEEKRRELKKGFDEITQRKTEAENRKKILESDLSGFNKSQAALSKPTPPVPDPFPGAARLKEIAGELAFADRKGQEAIVSRALEADLRIQQLRREIADGEKWAAELTAEIAELAQALHGRQALADRIKDVSTRQTAAADAAAIAYAAAEAAKATAEASGQGLVAARKRQAQRDQAQAAIGTKALELVDWRLLERATGPDGIPALELDALAPGIAEVANALLVEAYGPRYRIEFRTLRTGGTGAKKKQIETFEIWIMDSENGDEQEIATLSGGEGIWIKAAIYAAFARIRTQNTGIEFRTCFLDEADGALDPEARQQYLRMLEAAHRQSGRYQTILISHSTEIQAMVDQKIDVTALPAPDSPTGKEVA
jgi:exonuclease SbcC